MKRKALLVILLLVPICIGWLWWTWAMTVDADMGACSGGAKTQFFSDHQTALIDCYSTAYGLDTDIVVLGAHYTTMEWAGSKIDLVCEGYPNGPLHAPQSLCFSGTKTAPGQYQWEVRRAGETVVDKGLAG